MSGVKHGVITEPCSSLWRRGNGYLASLRTYSSCVLVRSGIELLREGVVDMVLDEVLLGSEAVCSLGRDLKSCYEGETRGCSLKWRAGSGKTTDTPLRYAN